MRGVFYGQLSEVGHHAHDAMALVDRVPLLIMIFTSITFGLLPGRMLDVIRSGVNPILARIMEVAPVVTQTGKGLLP
jgi:NADH-quinone oxidoreductase subunit M